MPSNPNTIVILFVAIIFFGYVFKRTGILKIEDSRSLVNLILYFTLPAVVLKTFYKAHISYDMLWVFLISIGFGLFMTLFGIYFFRNNSKKSHKGLLMASCMGFNIGLFAYPFVQAMWGNKGLLYIAIFDLGNAFMVFGASYIVASIYSPSAKQINYWGIIKKLIIFVPLQSYIIAIIFALLPVTYPDIFIKFLDLVSGANSVLVLLLIGMFLSFKISKEDLSDAFKVLFLRYAAGIIVGLLVFFVLPFPPQVRNTVMLGLILPIGMTIIPYSVMFNYDSKLSGTLVNLSSVISFMLMWIIIAYV
jgi:malate permease and related proteins